MLYGKQWFGYCFTFRNSNSQQERKSQCQTILHFDANLANVTDFAIVRLSPFLFGLLYHVFYWCVQYAIKDSKVHYQNPFQYIKVRSIVSPLGLLLTGLLNQSKVSRTFVRVSVTLLFVLSYCSVLSNRVTVVLLI